MLHGAHSLRAAVLKSARNWLGESSIEDDDKEIFESIMSGSLHQMQISRDFRSAGILQKKKTEGWWYGKRTRKNEDPEIPSSIWSDPLLRVIQRDIEDGYFIRCRKLLLAPTFAIQRKYFNHENISPSQMENWKSKFLLDIKRANCVSRRRSRATLKGLSFSL